MAKKRRSSTKRKGALPSTPVVAPAAVPAEDQVTGGVGADRVPLWDRFWNQPFTEARLALFRFLFFGCVAFESFRDLEHAPRYGAGGFNVPHFDLLALLPMPSRYAMVVLLLTQFALALRVAFGLGTRVTVWSLTAIYGYTYFISQLDSYQHHYLVFLFLVLMSLVDWESEKPRTWPVQLVIVQTAIVYFWAGVTKVQPLWVDGTLLRMQVGGGEFHQQVVASSASVGISVDTAYALMADYAVLMEFGVPVVFLVAPMLAPSRLRDVVLGVACLVGLGLHVGIEFAGLKIGLFSYMMMAFYVLVAPQPVVDWVGGLWRATLGGLGTGLQGLDHGGTRDLVFGLGLAVAAWSVWRLPIEYSGAAAAVITLVALGSEWPIRPGRVQRAVGHLLVGLTVLYAAASGETLRKYWYYLGGDARRRGDVALAIYGYSNTAAVDPTYGSAYVRWGQMLERESRFDEARETYELGLASVDETTFDLYQQLALVCSRSGDSGCAISAATSALGFKQDPRMQAIAANGR